MPNLLKDDVTGETRRHCTCHGYTSVDGVAIGVMLRGRRLVALLVVNVGGILAGVVDRLSILAEKKLKLLEFDSGSCL